MKRNVWKSAFLACVVMLVAAVVVVACDSSDDAGKQYDFEKMELTFTYEVIDDVLKVADVSFSYEEANAEGVVAPVTETLTTTKWVKQMSATTLPADFSIQVRVTRMEEFKEYQSDGKVHWMETPDVERHSVTLPYDSSSPETFEAALKAELALWNRTFAYVVKRDPNGGYDVEDND